MFTTIKNFRNAVTNAITGIGSVLDVGSNYSLSTTYDNFSDAEIIAAYTTSGQVQRVIDAMPESASNFVLYEDQAKLTIFELSEYLQQRLDSLQISSNFQLASKSSRLFKESYLLMVTEQSDLSLPLDESEFIFELMQLETDQLTFKMVDGKRQYQLSTISTIDTKRLLIKQEIHESRLLVFVGNFYPSKVRDAFGGYNGNVIGSFLTSYGSYRHSLNISLSLLARLSTFVYKLQGLRSLVEQQKANTLKERLQTFKKFIGSLGGFVIDAENESVEWLQMQITSVPELVNLHSRQFTADTELTHDQLWNEGSHNTASLLESTNWYNRVNEYLNTHWQDNFNKLYKQICFEVGATEFKKLYLGLRVIDTNKTTTKTATPPIASTTLTDTTITEINPTQNTNFN